MFPEPKNIFTKEWDLIQRNGIQSILSDPGSSPWPIWGSSALCFVNMFPSLFVRNSGLPPAWALCFLSGVYSGCGLLTSYDTDLGCSVSSAWSLIYLVTFSNSIKSTTKWYPRLSFGYMGLTALCYLKEMMS